MKIRRIFFCFFSCLTSHLFAQSVTSEEAKHSYEWNGMMGADVVHAGMALFSDTKRFQGFFTTEMKSKMYAVLDVGHEKNHYDKNGYNAQAKGLFMKLGAYYMLFQDNEQKRNGFYAGGKIAGSFYAQTYFMVPIKGYGAMGAHSSLPPSNQSTYWVEGLLGGRVKIFDSPFFIDVNIQPRYWIYTTKQAGLQPMIVPGFGKSSSRFAMGFSWNMGYYF